MKDFSQEGKLAFAFTPDAMFRHWDALISYSFAHTTLLRCPVT